MCRISCGINRIKEAAWACHAVFRGQAGQGRDGRQVPGQHLDRPKEQSDPG